MSAWLTSPVTNLRTLLSTLSAFQSFVGAGSAAVAAASVYIPETSERPLEVTQRSSDTSLRVRGNHSAILQEGRRIKLLTETEQGVTYQQSGDATYSGISNETLISVGSTLPSDVVGTDRLIPCQLPRAIIGPNGGRTRRRVSTTGFNTNGGGLYLILQAEPSSARWNPASDIDNVEGAYADFAGDVQDIIDQLETNQGIDDALPIYQIDESDPIMQISEDFNFKTPYWHAQFVLHTGR